MNHQSTPTPAGPPATAPPAKRTRRTDDPAFKQAALEHCRRYDGDVTRTATELGLNAWTLRDWLAAERRRQAPPAPTRSLAEAEAEVARLRAELARATDQRDILKNRWASSP